MHIWTNTFTKHSKCYKMGCIGPIGFFLSNLDLYTNQSSTSPLLCTTDAQPEEACSARESPTEAPEDPISFLWCSHQMKEKKRSFLLQGSSIQHQTQVKRVAMGGRPNETLEVCENMSQ